MKAVILGSKQRIRRLATTQSYPSALATLKPGGDRVMDWIITALQESGIQEIIYVGGYHIEKVIQRYPFLRFYYDKNWKKSSDIESFLVAQDTYNEPVVIISGNIVFRRRAVELLCNYRKKSCVIACINGKTLSDYEKAEFGAINTRNHLNYFAHAPGRPAISKGSIFFAGMIYLPKNLVPVAIAIAKQLSPSGKGTLLDLVNALYNKGHMVYTVQVGKYWSSLYKTPALAQFVMGTKAQTLERLRPLVKKSVILPQVKFTVKEWEKDSEGIIARVQEICGKKNLVVRSSALHEDSWQHSHAGTFHTELNVNGKNAGKISMAVQNVLDSYRDRGFTSKRNQILIQPKLLQATLSGVLFTRDLNYGAPYYIINYDRKSSRTNTVTSGNSAALETKIVYRNYKGPVDNGWCDRLLEAAREIEELLSYNCLDIEFALDRENTVYILQVRPLIMKQEELSTQEEDFDAELQGIQHFLQTRFKESPYVLGKKNLLGEMPDWNPVEMIGSSPKPLSLSLYQKLITDRVWAEARKRMGYRDVHPEPLMFSLAGKPYIDVRNSFNSFILSSLRNNLGEKLVDHCIIHLKEHPELHDKVEFEVMLTCYDFTFDTKVKRLEKAGFEIPEIEEVKDCYRTFTDDIILNAQEYINSHLALFHILENRRNQVLKYDACSLNEIPWVINALINDAADYGTIPFSILARYAFIALILLQTLVKKGIFTVNEYNTLLHNIPTIATAFNNDIVRLQCGKITKKQFLDQYGHLRPNTYDICSMNYTTLFEKKIFFETPSQKRVTIKKGSIHNARKIWENRKASITKVLKDHGFQASADSLFSFIVIALPARERGKFEFSKNLNAILEKVALLGSLLGFDREAMSYVSIEKIVRLATDCPSSVLKAELERTINFEKKRHNLTRSMRLPFLIDSPYTIQCFELQRWRPNFITSKKVFGEVVDLSQDTNTADLEGKIVLIQGADPGYEWIFSRSISGLITQYGGSGSHMAIRAAEFGIPAAIGCGDIIFNEIKKSRFVEIDCNCKTIQIRA